MDSKKYKCKYCGKYYDSPRSLAAHCSHCKNISIYGHDVLKGVSKRGALKIIHTLRCKECGKEYQILCTDSEISSSKIKKFCSDECRKKYMKNIMTGNKMCACNKSGYSLTEETRLKISESMKRSYKEGRHGYKKWTPEEREKYSIIAKENNKKYWTPERRQEQSERMKKIVIEKQDSYSYKNVSGRVKYIEYNGFSLHGNWELSVAKWLDAINLDWTNKVDGIKYVYKDSSHLYFPDFYIQSMNLYIEVKGYETEKDRIKWESCKKQGINLIILKKNDIYKLTKNNVNINVFIENNKI